MLYNDEVRIFDAKPYLTKGVFKELQDIHLFKTVKVFDETTQWIHEQDLCPDTLYEKGYQSFEYYIKILDYLGNFLNIDI